MGDCLAEVKKDLGKDAVILHTRTYKVGGVLGIGAKPMVEVTASDGANAPPRRKSGNIAALKAYTAQPSLDLGAIKPDPDRAAQNAAARNERAMPVPAPTDAVEAEPPVVVTVPQRMPVVRTGATVETQDLRSGATPSPRSVAVHAAPSAAPSTGGDRVLTEEIASLKRMVGQILQCSRQTAVQVSREGGQGFSPAMLPDPLFQPYVQMLEGDLEAELADEVIARVREERPARELETADAATIRASLIRALCTLIRVEPPADVASIRAPESRPLTLALVGPTGVGKTTTIAKLAATFKLRQGRRVGLITCDTYRIAAVDQLRTYAEIIGLPLKVAMSPADMASCCQSLDDCDVVLVDTAGRSPRDSGRLDELRRFIAAAEPHETHLVLSSVSSRSVMLEAAGRFMPIRPDRLIFTKLDEAVSYGTLFSVARKIDLGLSYITTGQEVPDHIEPSRPERLAELLLAEKGAAP
jgi:flagellar biosynthesis protein FlhF